MLALAAEKLVNLHEIRFQRIDELEDVSIYIGNAFTMRPSLRVVYFGVTTWTRGGKHGVLCHVQTFLRPTKPAWT